MAVTEDPTAVAVMLADGNEFPSNVASPLCVLIDNASVGVAWNVTRFGNCEGDRATYCVLSEKMTERMIW